MRRIPKKEWLFILVLVTVLRAGSIGCLFVGWKFVDRADYGEDLWITRPATSFMDNLANFDGAWFVRLASLGYQRLAAGDYDLGAETERLRVMDRLGYEQARWPREPGTKRFDRGYGYRHWPLLVWLVAGMERIGLDPVYAGVVLSNLFSALYGIVLYVLARKDMGKTPAAMAVALSQLHPGGYALSGLYNESLFLVLAAGAMLSARKGNWWITGLLGMAAATTRIFGVVLAAPLAYEWLTQRAQARGKSPDFASVLGLDNIGRGISEALKWPGLWWVMLIPAGTGVVLAFFHFTAGDAMIWTRVHEGNVHGTINWPWLMLAETYHKGRHIWIKELPLHALLFLVLVFSFGRVRGSYWVWMLLFFMYHTSNGNHSYLRYQVQCVPMFIAIARLSGDRGLWAAPLLLVFAGLAGFFGAMFINGYWVA